MTSSFSIRSWGTKRLKTFPDLPSSKCWSWDCILSVWLRVWLAITLFHRNHPPRSILARSVSHLGRTDAVLEVNMASYKAIRCSVQQLHRLGASKTGIACNMPTDKVWLGGVGKGLRDPVIGGGEATLTISFNWFCHRCRACLTLWDREGFHGRCFPKGYSSTCHQHHLSALILQHWHLTMTKEKAQVPVISLSSHHKNSGRVD